MATEAGHRGRSQHGSRSSLGPPTTSRGPRPCSSLTPPAPAQCGLIWHESSSSPPCNASPPPPTPAPASFTGDVQGGPQVPGRGPQYPGRGPTPLTSCPRVPGPHQLCCAGPTGSEQHARAAPAVLCRPHRNPRTPGPHQLCCAGPTGTRARQGRTGCAVQAPQEPPHARAAPALLCRLHRNPCTPGPHQLSCAGPTGNKQRPSTPALVRFRATQANGPLPCRGGAAAESKGNRGPAGPRTGGPSSQPPQPASVLHRSGHPLPRSRGGLGGNTHRWLLPPPCARSPPPDMAAPTPPPRSSLAHARPA